MRTSATILILAVLAPSASVCAQCLPQWSAHGENLGGWAFTVWDKDGAGPARPALVAGGYYRKNSAVDLKLVGQFDGRIWRPIGEGLGTVGHVEALCVAETSGVGSPAPGLYAGGGYRRASGEPSHHLSHWDGKTWEHIGGENMGAAHCLLMFDEDGPGPGEANLFVAGGLINIAGLDFPGLYRWDGTEASLVGGSLQAAPLEKARGNVMAIFDDDGAGPRPPALYVAGSFVTAGGVAANNIARWDGRNWEALGLGLGSGVRALAVFDADGDGPEPAMLYADGRYEKPGGPSSSYLSRWDGKQWTEVPGYDGGGVYSLAVFDDDGDGPSKPALFVGGIFTSVNRVYSPGVIKWDGTDWLAIDGGVGGLTGALPDAMAAFDEDGDPATPPGLYMGGTFLTAGSLWAPGLARWGCPMPTCYADCEASTGFGKLDIFDFLCFQDSFVSGEPYACDCDTSTGNGVCDIFDFLCFQNAFVGGCP